MMPMTPIGEESNSIGFRSFNPMNFEDSVNLHHLCNQNSNTSPALFLMMDGSFGFHNISYSRAPYNQDAFLNSIIKEDEGVIDNSLSEDEKSEDDFQIGGKQKLSTLASRVKRIIDKLNVTTAQEITQNIIGQQFQKEITKQNQTQIRRVKRRIYDTINVFTAVGEITKNKKKIIKNVSQETQCSIKTDNDLNSYQTNILNKLKSQVALRQQILKTKVDLLSSRYKQYDALYSIINRNSQTPPTNETKIPFPFIAIISDKDQSPETVSQKNLLKLRFQKQMKVLGDLDLLQLLVQPSGG